MQRKGSIGSLIVAAVVLASCGDSGGGGGGPSTPQTPRLSIALGASTITLTQGENNTVAVTITRSGGFNGAVNLALEGAPEGVSGSFDPASVSAGSTSSTLTLDASLTAATGSHSLTVRASAQGVQERTASLGLDLQARPSISVAVDPEEVSLVQARDGTLEVTVARTNFPGAVALSLEEAPDGVTGAFDPATLTNNATTSTLALAVAEGAALGEGELVVGASGEGVDATTTIVALTVEPTPRVALSVEATALTLNQGASGGAVVKVTRTNFSGEVELALEDAPAGVSGTFAPASIPPEANESTLSLSIGEDTPTGSGALVIRASGEGIEDQTTTLALTINPAPAYTLTLEPASLIIAQGGSGTAEIQLARTNFTGAVALSVTGAPTGVSASVSPASATGNAATLTVNAGNNAEAGEHTLTITGQAQGLENRTATLELTVTQDRGFGLAVSPSSLTLEQGETATATVTITRTGGFTGAVALAVEDAPASLTATVDPTSVSGNSATVTLEAAGNIAPGNYPLTIRGSAQVAPGQTHEATATLTATVQAITAGNWVQVSSGHHHACAVNEAGEAYCWGRNHVGQLGDGTTTQRMRPRLVTGGHTWVSVSAGHNHTCGITTAGNAFCWGAGGSGRLGNGSTANSPTPEPVAVTGGDTWVILKAGGEHTCGLTPDGRAYCWGYNRSGQAGDGTTTHPRTTRVLVAGDHTWQSISVGHWHSCGLTTAGEAYCWGWRANGRVGDGGTSGSATLPSLVQGNHTWAQVNARSWHSCGITTTGDGYCWGYNLRGQLGSGNTTNQSTPTPVLNDLRWSHLDPGWEHTTCGITQTGEAFCWGYNFAGQVGDGTTGNKTAPQAVAGGFAWRNVTGGATHSCGINEAQVAYCWGRGAYGEMGNGTAASTIYSTPIRVLDPQ